MERVLIVYSSPEDTERIRLDREHRAVDQAIAETGVPLDTVIRKHATTLKDISSAVADTEFSVFHFSGHGSRKGMYLDTDSGPSGELVAAEKIAALVSKAQPRLKAAIFMSCFSSTAIPKLIRMASYLLTVSGTADDGGTIDFVREFYRHYFRHWSISQASLSASLFTNENLHILLSRRATHSPSKPLFEVLTMRDRMMTDSILIDLGAAEGDIQKLGVSRDAFLNLLTRKIRLHHWIFDAPREKAILPIGNQYIGVFSWQNAADPICCHRILRIKSEVSQDDCDCWAALTIGYNEDVAERYRLEARPAAPHNARILDRAIENYRESYQRICTWRADTLSKYVPEQYKLTRSIMLANLDMAERKLHGEDFAGVVFHLECTLSAEHDLLDALTDTLAV